MEESLDKTEIIDEFKLMKQRLEKQVIVHIEALYRIKELEEEIKELKKKEFKIDDLAILKPKRVTMEF